MADKLTAVILVGGKGTRIRSLYPDLPKPLIPVKGKPFLYWLTKYLAGLGLSDFVFSAGHLHEKVEAWIADEGFEALRLRICVEATPLGTGGAVLNCLDCCGDWVVVSNGDSICTSGVERLLKLPADERLDGGLIGLPCPDTGRFGRLEIDKDGLLTGFSEKVPGAGVINAGVYLFKTSLLRKLAHLTPSSMEYDLFPEMLRSGAKLRVIEARDADFIDIGTPETVCEAEAFITANESAFS